MNHARSPRSTLTLDRLGRLRAYNFRQVSGRHVRTEAKALEFINEVGFLSLIDLAGTQLPSLQMADDRDDWADYKTRTLKARWWWAWKQTLPGRKACYYAKILRGRGTFISWRYFPYFYAAYASGRDVETDYRLGLVPRSDKRIMDLLLERGPMDTRSLRLAYAPPSKENTRQLERALARLQAAFRICCAGGSLKGWTLHRWAVVENWAPRRTLLRKSEKLRHRPRDAVRLLPQRSENVGQMLVPLAVRLSHPWPALPGAAPSEGVHPVVDGPL